MQYQTEARNVTSLEYLSLPVSGELLGITGDQITNLDCDTPLWVAGGRNGTPIFPMRGFS